MSFIHKVVTAIDNHFHTIGIFLDFSTAFDTIYHKILFKKLSHYGIIGKALEWFQDYLSDRKQFVIQNGERSSMQSLNFHKAVYLDLCFS